MVRISNFERKKQDRHLKGQLIECLMGIKKRFAGGTGLDPISMALLTENLAYGCTGVATGMLTNGLAQAPLIIGGSEELKKKYLGMMTEEPLIAVRLYF